MQVHYLGNAGRGTVWEEIIINCPSHIQMLAMSATVANPDDLGSWITKVTLHSTSSSAESSAISSATSPASSSASIVPVLLVVSTEHQISWVVRQLPLGSSGLSLWRRSAVRAEGDGAGGHVIVPVLISFSLPILRCVLAQL